MENITTSQLDQLLTETYTRINDSVYCTLLDVGVDPGEAWTMVNIDIPLDPNQINPSWSLLPNTLTDHDDVFLMHQ